MNSRIKIAVAALVMCALGRADAALNIRPDRVLLEGAPTPQFNGFANKVDATGRYALDPNGNYILAPKAS